jgi:hypothetical protein
VRGWGILPISSFYSNLVGHAKTVFYSRLAVEVEQRELKACITIDWDIQEHWPSSLARRRRYAAE